MLTACYMPSGTNHFGMIEWSSLWLRQRSLKNWVITFEMLFWRIWLRVVCWKIPSRMCAKLSGFSRWTMFQNTLIIHQLCKTTVGSNLTCWLWSKLKSEESYLLYYWPLSTKECYVSITTPERGAVKIIHDHWCQRKVTDHLPLIG